MFMSTVYEMVYVWYEVAQVYKVRNHMIQQQLLSLQLNDNYQQFFPAVDH